MIFAIEGASSSAWRCASTVTSWASGWPPSWSATVTAGVAVSSPSSSTTNERSAPSVQPIALQRADGDFELVCPGPDQPDRQTILAATWRATVVAAAVRSLIDTGPYFLAPVVWLRPCTTAVMMTFR
jgi:hypothetical protein